MQVNQAETGAEQEMETDEGGAQAGKEVEHKFFTTAAHRARRRGDSVVHRE